MNEVISSRIDYRRQVLVVDDEIINRQLLGFIVSRDYEVLYAENGREAFNIIQKNAGMLSLILLDLLMPGMDGYELLELLHNDEELRRIPVIVLTSEKTAEVRCLNLGAVDFIPKPYDMPDVILARISRSIQLAEDNIIIRAMEIDSISGLYNREFFFQYIDRHNKYYPDVIMDAWVLNINRFHIINELNGRQFGNSLLQSIGKCIKDLLNTTEGFACRCESDNFYIYIRHNTPPEKLLDSIRAAIEALAGNARFSLRMGIFEGGSGNFDNTTRFDKALHACNTLRNSFVTNYAYYNMQMYDREIHQEQLLQDIDTALAENQFCVYYQPKYNIKNRRPILASAEALVRWKHPEFGFLTPRDFIHLFEENGMIHQLDKYVWNEAAAQIRRWKDKFGFSLPISVNVSRIDIYDPELENELLDVIRKNGLDPQELLLEITESAYTDNSHQIIDTVERLRKDGFRIEMDDFGSGYSSLNMLAELPIDALKLDMVFMRNICTNEKDYRMVELMIEIAEFLSVPVIAEGIEKEDQLKILRAVGCDIIQGYYFSKPVPSDVFDHFIERELLMLQEDN